MNLEAELESLSLGKLGGVGNNSMAACTPPNIPLRLVRLLCAIRVRECAYGEKLYGSLS